MGTMLQAATLLPEAFLPRSLACLQGTLNPTDPYLISKPGFRSNTTLLLSVFFFFVCLVD